MQNANVITPNSPFARTFPGLEAHAILRPAMNYSSFVNAAMREGLNDACDIAHDLGVPAQTIEGWVDQWLAAMSDF